MPAYIREIAHEQVKQLDLTGLSVTYRMKVESELVSLNLTHETTPEAQRRVVIKTADDVSDIVSATIHVANSFTELLKKVDSEISFTHWSLLNVVRSEGAMRPYKAAARLRISRQLVFQSSKKLERIGYVSYTSEEDKRAVLLSITEDGIKFLNTVDKAFQSAASTINTHNPNASFRPFRAMLAIMLNSFEQKSGE